MKLTIYNSILIALILIASACQKDKRISNRIDGKVFYMWDLTIDGQSQIDYDSLSFNNCKIYKDLCTGIWKRNGGESSFYWQINEKGKELVISNNQTLEFTPSNSRDYNAINQCYNLSGKYEIIKFDKNGKQNNIYVKSFETKGYPGKEVSFTLKAFGYN